LLDLVPLQGVSTINVASNDVLDVRRIANAISALLGRAARFRVSEAVRPFDLVADTSRLNALLAPRFVTFERGLSETVEAALSR
jgi:hypothetical protein